jgi:hypothetical protein
VLVCRRLAGHFVEAEREGLALWREQIALLGSEHEDCFATEIEIGRCAFDRGDFVSAGTWFESLNRRAEKSLVKHPYRWVILGEWSRTLATLSMSSMAIETGQEALKGLTDLLGGRHPATLKQKKELAQRFVESGQVPLGVSLLQQVLLVEESEYGVDDARVNSTRAELELLTVATASR